MTQVEVRRLAHRVGALLRKLGPLPDGCSVTFVVHDDLSGNVTVGSPRDQRETAVLLKQVSENIRPLWRVRPKGLPS